MGEVGWENEADKEIYSARTHTHTHKHYAQIFVLIRVFPMKLLIFHSIRIEMKNHNTFFLFHANANHANAVNVKKEMMEKRVFAFENDMERTIILFKLQK